MCEYANIHRRECLKLFDTNESPNSRLKMKPVTARRKKTTCQLISASHRIKLKENKNLINIWTLRKKRKCRT